MILRKAVLVTPDNSVPHCHLSLMCGSSSFSTSVPCTVPLVGKNSLCMNFSSGLKSQRPGCRLCVTGTELGASCRTALSVPAVGTPQSWGSASLCPCVCSGMGASSVEGAIPLGQWFSILGTLGLPGKLLKTSKLGIHGTERPASLRPGGGRSWEQSRARRGQDFASLLAPKGGPGV